MHGIQSTSYVGKPGTPHEERTPINCGVWRYHPTRQVFEVVVHGTTNPWGLDFDEHGEAFITNCVIPHLFHVVPGARFQRMFGQDFNPFSYELMPTCADHVHWDTVEAWSDIRRRGVTPTTDKAGGGHAHVGAMVYLGDNWPESMRGGVFTCNVHGHRINHDRLEREKSGYVARHEKDFLLANDTWFRGLELKYGPDGGVYLTDWSDTGECHETDADNAHRENGRIYKITFGHVKPPMPDLAKLDDANLAGFVTHANEWYARTARRLLQERAAAGRDTTPARDALMASLDRDDDVTVLRALWALNAIGQADDAMLTALLDRESESVRNWAVRLLGDDGTVPDHAVERFAKLATADPSARVRLALASALQRLPLEQRWPIAEALAARAEEAEDTPLVLMTWYGMDPLVPADPARAASLAERAAIPKLRQFLARRVVSADVATGLSLLVPPLERDDDAHRHDLLTGIYDALRGRKTVEAPERWPELYGRLARSDDPAVREQSAMLGLIFGDPAASTSLWQVAMTRDADRDARRRALEVLTERRARGTAALALGLLDDDALRPSAIRALAAFDDPATPTALLERYGKLSGTERDDALTTLASRPGFARALLDAVGAGRVPRRDLTATTARQILGLNDAKLSERLGEVWGTIRPTAAAKSELLAKYKGLLGEESAPALNPARGRAVFNKVCLQCHRLFGAGGDVGPELTGSDRASADYILENVLDPSSAVGRDYRLANVMTTDGRLVSGVLKEQNDASIVVQTVNEKVVLPREDIEEMKLADTSMMPEGLLEGLTPQEVRDLFGYLAAPGQVELP
jgi:putative heme-binding domain-containing protein